MRVNINELFRVVTEYNKINQQNQEISGAEEPLGSET
jgi:hypothetical protein